MPSPNALPKLGRLLALPLMLALFLGGFVASAYDGEPVYWQGDDGVIRFYGKGGGQSSSTPRKKKSPPAQTRKKAKATGTKKAPSQKQLIKESKPGQDGKVLKDFESGAKTEGPGPLPSGESGSVPAAAGAAPASGSAGPIEPEAPASGPLAFFEDLKIPGGLPFAGFALLLLVAFFLLLRQKGKDGNKAAKSPEAPKAKKEPKSKDKKKSSPVPPPPVAPMAATTAPKGTADCPTCGAENDPHAGFCEQCGSPMAGQASPPPPPTPAPTPPPSPVSSDAFCGTCGAKNDSGAKFCEECGAPFDQGAASTAPNHEPILAEIAAPPVWTDLASDKEEVVSPPTEEEEMPFSHEEPREHLICGDCGAPNEPDTRFCQECGAPFEEVMEPEKEVLKASPNSEWEIDGIFEGAPGVELECAVEATVNLDVGADVATLPEVVAEAPSAEEESQEPFDLEDNLEKETHVQTQSEMESFEDYQEEVVVGPDEFSEPEAELEVSGYDISESSDVEIEPMTPPPGSVATDPFAGMGDNNPQSDASVFIGDSHDPMGMGLPAPLPSEEVIDEAKEGVDFEGFQVEVSGIFDGGDEPAETEAPEFSSELPQPEETPAQEDYSEEIPQTSEQPQETWDYDPDDLPIQPPNAYLAELGESFEAPDEAHTQALIEEAHHAVDITHEWVEPEAHSHEVEAQPQVEDNPIEESYFSQDEVPQTELDPANLVTCPLCGEANPTENATCFNCGGDLGGIA